MTPLFAVVLAGGIGSRFWPLSTAARPKQLLPLVSDRPMLVETAERLVPLVGRAHVLILTSAGLHDAVHAALPWLAREQILVEPRPAGTAAALAWAIWRFPAVSPDNAVFAYALPCLWLFLWPLGGEDEGGVTARQ